MKQLLFSAVASLAFLVSASAQTLSIQITSPADGSKINGKQFYVQIEICNSASPAMGGSTNHISGTVDGAFWFDGYSNLYGTTECETISVPYQTNEKGNHVFVVTVNDAVEIETYYITLKR